LYHMRHMPEETIQTEGQTTIVPTGDAAAVSVKPIGHRHLTLDEIKNGCVKVGGENQDDVRICRIDEELKQGITEMEAYETAVTFYGSARFKEGDEFYDKARVLGSRVAKETGYAIVTGGGPGIMEGGNRGAFEAGGKSVGLSIKLPMEQHNNTYVTDDVPFYFFFARKVALSYSSEVFVFFPGGFGTMDEMFEVLTLVQTGKLKPIPIILYGSHFWNPLVEFFKSMMLNTYKTISEKDLDLFTVTDDDDTVLDIIRQAKLRTDNHLD
jgi:uncharacterized protein (TIGR00730 family)